MPLPALEMSRRLHEQVLRDMELAHRNIEEMQRTLVRALMPLMRGVQQTTQQLGGIPEASDEDEDGGNGGDGDEGRPWDGSTTAVSDGDGDMTPRGDDDAFSEILRRGRLAHQRAGSESSTRSDARNDAELQTSRPARSPVSTAPEPPITVAGPYAHRRNQSSTASSVAAARRHAAAAEHGAPGPAGYASYPQLHIAHAHQPFQGHRSHLSLEHNEVPPLFVQAPPGLRPPLVVQPHIHRRSPSVPQQPTALLYPQPRHARRTAGGAHGAAPPSNGFEDLNSLMQDLTGRRPPPSSPTGNGDQQGFQRRQHWRAPPSRQAAEPLEETVGRLNVI